MVDSSEQEIQRLKQELAEVKAELAAAKPALPPIKPATVEPQTTAFLVLDLGARWSDPKLASSKFILGIRDFLARARANGLYNVFTISAIFKGKPEGEVFSGFNRRPDEPVIYPDGYDKFSTGELQDLLKGKGIKTVIITGYLANIAVLYTATTASRAHRYQVIIPADGIGANTVYEQDYTLHQLSVLPGGVSDRISFTNLKDISFQRG